MKNFFLKMNSTSLLQCILKWRRIKNFRFIILTLLCSLLALPIQATESKSILQRLRLVGTGDEGAGFKEVNEEGDIYFAERLGSIVKIFLSFLGALFAVLIIYGGFMWMTAEGNEDRVTKAKQVIINSTIGIIIVMLAYAITYFVIYKFGIATEFNTGL